MSMVHHNISKLASEHRQPFHDVIDSHLDDNRIKMHLSNMDHTDTLRRAVKQRVLSNKTYPSNYSHRSAHGPTGTPSSKPPQMIPHHTPEGIAHEPDEAERQVENFHKESFGSSQERDSFYKSKFGNDKDVMHMVHGRTKPLRYGKTATGKADYDKDYYADNPHVVSRYLNTMHKHFPHVSDEFAHGKLNYASNLKVSDHTDWSTA